MSKPLKLILTYEMREDAGQEYFQFMMGRYGPEMEKMGVALSEAWGKAYGNGPMRMLVFVSRDEATMWEALDSEMWQTLNEKIEEYVVEREYKVIPYREGFQL